jgi:outer membrane protein
MRYCSLLLLLFFCSPAIAQKALVGDLATSRARIAYVNIDSLEAHYSLFVTQTHRFAAMKDQMETNLKAAYDSIQSQAADLQQRVAKDSLTEDQFKTEQKRLYQMQQSLEASKQDMTDKLTQYQVAFNADLRARLNAFLEKYNKTHHYDCILSYSSESVAILYIDKRLDITRDVVAGLNATDVK